MKQVKILWLVAALFCATTAFGKDIKTVVFKTTPEMYCNNCETKIKNNLRFEKGVKEIVTDLGDKTVTVKYDADKTTVEALIKRGRKKYLSRKDYLPRGNGRVLYSFQVKFWKLFDR